MLIKARKIKQAYIECENDNAHGKTPIELTIRIGGKVLKVWLCDSCINKLQNEFTVINIKGGEI
jgi:hypothetical protein